MGSKQRNVMLTLLAIFFVGQGLMQRFAIFDRWRLDYAPKSAGVATGLDPSQLLAALAGFRELVAGILWVRADSFFDEGNYDAVLPIIRLVTWLDPHQIDVYATGMWHIGYNFTDEESRSDRRYLPAAIALGKEGAHMNDQTYELFFETGWLWFHKIDDLYDNAVYWFEEARKRPDMLPARKNLLAPAYIKAGRVDEALELYLKLHDEADALFEIDHIYQTRQIRDTLENNIDTQIVRMVQRGWFAGKRNDGTLRTNPYDVNPMFDVGFSVRATVEEPKIIRFEGTYNVLPVGTRIRVVLKDHDFPFSIPGGADWGAGTEVKLDPDPTQTFMQDQLYVKNRRFNRKVDMSRDPTMYPFASDKYVVEFYYNPRSAPPHIQDKFGYNGEGMTDKRFMNTEVRKGQKVLYARFEFTRDELLRRGKWAEAENVPVRQTPNFVAGGAGPDVEDVIVVPNLRAPSKKP